VKERSLQAALTGRVRVLETTLQPSTTAQYRHTARWFLRYLGTNFPEIGKLSKLRRDPHLLGWLEQLWTYRTSLGQPLTNGTRRHHVMCLRKLLEMFSDGPDRPISGLLRGEDIPPRQYGLPRPLSPEDDTRLEELWSKASDVHSSALWLQRLAGMRIGECVDLVPDCLRHLGDNRWTLHVPHGKPRSERWVPVDDRARILVERLRFLRTLPPGADPRYLLARPKGRNALLSALREALREAAGRVGIEGPIVPHQLRHTYATSMLRAGVSLPALMKLLGHHNANMTLLYVEVTQRDLQCEFHAARLEPRHRVPVPALLQEDEGSVAGSPGSVLAALLRSLGLMEIYRKGGQGPAGQKELLLLVRRIERIRYAFEKLAGGAAGEK
jgi:integrase